MTTVLLRQVLQIFETAAGPLTLAEVARLLDIEEGILEGMLEYWVRKGRLRKVTPYSRICSVCGEAKTCPFLLNLPARYELITDDEPDLSIEPPCLKK